MRPGQASAPHCRMHCPALGLLYYLSKAESTDSADLRLYIPESLRHSYMVAFHDSAGHLGVERMCRLLRARVYWPKLSQDVADYVRECHECTLGKPPMRTLAQPSGPQVGAYPFDIVYCDILSMAPTHDYVKGKSGYDKLVVYVDSLTRWIEAHPVNGDPPSLNAHQARLSPLATLNEEAELLFSDTLHNHLTEYDLTQYTAKRAQQKPTTQSDRIRQRQHTEWVPEAGSTQ
eukprot:scaffold13114_cov143-Isochrysis_galbana.AAC.3